MIDANRPEIPEIVERKGCAAVWSLLAYRQALIHIAIANGIRYQQDEPDEYGIRKDRSPREIVEELLYAPSPRVPPDAIGRHDQGEPANHPKISECSIPVPCDSPPDARVKRGQPVIPGYSRRPDGRDRFEWLLRHWRDDAGGEFPGSVGVVFERSADSRRHLNSDTIAMIDRWMDETP